MKEAYYVSFYHRSRETLVNKCLDILKTGKKVAYILPSREAMFDVRNHLITSYGGIVDSYIFSFDDLEKLICQNKIPHQKIIPDNVIELILRDILNRNKDKSVFNLVKNKLGFISEVYQLIKRLKRLNISPEEFRNKSDLMEGMLERKCNFLANVYQEYEAYKKAEGLYDINDLSLLACEEVRGSQFLSQLGVLVIDGFIDIDPVYKLLLKNISETYPEIHLSANIPYKNIHNQTFIQKEILKDLEELGFALGDDMEENTYSVEPSIKILAENLYASQKVLATKASGIRILNSPCVEHEVRQGARIIKERLLKGETTPDKVAIYIQDLDLYKETIQDVFQEMGIPVQLSCGEKLISIPLVKDILNLFKMNFANQRFSSREECLQAFSTFLQNLALRGNIISGYGSGSLDAKEYLRDLKALETLENILNEFLELSQTYPHCYPGDIIQGIYLDLTNRCLETEIEIRKLDNSGVKVLNPDLARGKFYDLVLLLGVNEGLFPRLSAGNPLFDPLEDQQLFRIGINLINSRWEMEREKIRFNSCLAFTRKEVFLSYRTSDEEGGYLIKSPFIDEVESLMDEEVLKKVTAPVLYMRDRFLFQEKAASLREGIRKVSDRVWQKKGEEIEALDYLAWIIRQEELKDQLEYIHHSAQIELGRANKPYFDNYDGLLSNPQLAQQDAKYGFSPSQLNSYVSCPFKYYSERVLELSDLDEEEGLGARSLGSFYHEILHKYYSENDSWYKYDAERLKEIFQERVNIFNGGNLSAKIFQFIQEELWLVISAFLEQDALNLQYYYDKTGCWLKPIMLEQPFSINHSFGGNLLRGVVDRVDLEMDKNGEYTGKFIIYDYKKSSGKTLKDCLEVKDFQLPIYYLAIEDYLQKTFALENPECLALLYYSIEKNSRSGIVSKDFKKHLFKGSTGPRDLVGKNNLAILIEWIASRGGQLIEDIRQGKFNLPEACNSDTGIFSCSYRSICRYDRYRIAIKQKVGEGDA